MKDESNVSLSALPLKAREFFSIIFPGISVLLSAYFFEDLYTASQPSNYPPTLPVHWLLNETWRNVTSASGQAAIIAVSMCMIYLAGQLVSSIANFFLDRIFVYKCYGYPFEHLLFDDPKKDIFVDYFSRRFYRGSIFWLHTSVACFVWHIVNGTLLGTAWFCLGIFMIGFMLHLLGHPFYKYSKKIEDALKVLVSIYVLPYKWLTNPIQKINQTTKPMQKNLGNQYKVFFKNDFQIDPETAESDNYWLALFYVRQKDSQMGEFLHRWHQTAIFARNMATSFYMAFGYSAVILWYEMAWKKTLIQSPHNFRITIALAGLLILAIFLVIRFYLFHVSFYSKGLFRAFVFLHLYKDPKSAPE